MKPVSIGELPRVVEAASTTEAASNADTTSTVEPPKIDENETRLLYQEFLMKPNIRVLDFLNENHAKVNDFVRFECGENLDV